MRHNDLAAAIADSERRRRRERTENGRSPAQHTTRSINRARAHKRPGKRNRAAARRAALGWGTC